MQGSRGELGLLPKGYLQPGVRGSQIDKPVVAVQREGTEVCAGALGAGRGEDLLQKAIVRTKGGQARQKEGGPGKSVDGTLREL